MYPNPVTQVGAQNEDFGIVSRTEITRSLVLSVLQANM